MVIHANLGFLNATERKLQCLLLLTTSAVVGRNVALIKSQKGRDFIANCEKAGILEDHPPLH